MATALELQHASEFRRCLEQADAKTMMRLAPHVLPHYPAPRSETEALATIHVARCMTKSLPLRLRVYSKHWLKERGLAAAIPK